MKGLWAKSNIWILTAAGIAVAAYMALAWDAMPAGQRALGFFVVGIVAHEWEEMRFPGGFYDLMTRKFGVEGYTQVLGLFLLDDFLKRVDEADDGGGVQALRVDARALDKGVVRPVDEGVGVEQKEFIHDDFIFLA